MARAAKGPDAPSPQELPRTGRCLAYRCACPKLAELAGRTAGYLYCACGHTTLVHDRQEPTT